MTTIELILRTADGPVPVQAELAAPGLAVLKLPDQLRTPATRSLWRIAHHSGLIIGQAPDRTAALSGVRRIAPLTDWTREPHELTAAGQVDANAVSIALSWGDCDLLTSQPRAA